VSVATRPAAEPRLGPLTFGRLEALSFLHSAVYATLIASIFVPALEPAKTTLGWIHGVGWILMSLVMLAAARRRVVPFYLAVLVCVIGGIGPFAGTIGFIVEAHRRKRRASTS
jgi:hypothetical protein